MRQPKRGDVIRRDFGSDVQWYGVVEVVTDQDMYYITESGVANVTCSFAALFDLAPGWCYANPNDRAHNDIPESLWRRARSMV